MLLLEFWKLHFLLPEPSIPSFRVTSLQDTSVQVVLVEVNKITFQKPARFMN